MRRARRAADGRGDSGPHVGCNEHDFRRIGDRHWTATSGFLLPEGDGSWLPALDGRYEGGAVEVTVEVAHAHGRPHRYFSKNTITLVPGRNAEITFNPAEDAPSTFVTSIQASRPRPERRGL